LALLDDAKWCIPPYLDQLVQKLDATKLDATSATGEKKPLSGVGEAFSRWEEVNKVYLQLCHPEESLRRHVICQLTTEGGLEMVREVSGHDAQVEAAITIIQTVIAHRADLAQNIGRSHRIEISNFLLNLSKQTQTHHSDLASIASHHSVELLSDIVVVNFGSQKDSLAGSYAFLGNAYGELGNWTQARDAMQEAVWLYEKHAGEDETYLLEGLRSLASYHAALEDWAGAAKANQKAVMLSEKMIPSILDTDQVNLALDLWMVGYYLGRLERWHEAVAAARKGLEIYEGMFGRIPEKPLEDHITCLKNLCFYLGKLERWTEAVEEKVKVVNMYQSMFATSPDAYREQLATQFSHLGYYLSEAERWTEAVEAQQKSVALHEEMFAKSPDAHRGELAASLQVLGARLEEAKRWSECAATWERVVQFRREMFSDGDDSSRLSLADGLNYLAWNLCLSGRSADGLPPILESISLLRESSSPDSTSTKFRLSCSLDTAAVCLYSLVRFEEAVSYSEEAVSIARFLHQSGDIKEETHKDILETYRKVLEALGRVEEAREVEAERENV